MRAAEIMCLRRGGGGKKRREKAALCVVRTQEKVRERMKTRKEEGKS